MRAFLLIVALSSLAGCNASTMAGFAEAAREDRRAREYGYRSDSAEELRALREDLCDSRGGFMAFGDCIGD